jgi:hypothetical protein
LGHPRISHPIDQAFHTLIAELLPRSFDPPVYALDYSFGIIALKRSALDVSDECLLVGTKVLQADIFDVSGVHGFLAPLTCLILYPGGAKTNPLPPPGCG